MSRRGHDRRIGIGAALGIRPAMMPPVRRFEQDIVEAIMDDPPTFDISVKKILPLAA